MEDKREKSVRNREVIGQCGLRSNEFLSTTPRARFASRRYLYIRTLMRLTGQMSQRTRPVQWCTDQTREREVWREKGTSLPSTLHN
ncbi:hypothetical protein J6590_000127 [Homalodisca vitripennis]|nr:hypothetical protein J6590_000127 [Homalodisca vitripennis]